MNSHAWRVFLLLLAVSCTSCSGKNEDESAATTKEPQAATAADSGVAGKLQGQATDLDALVDLVVAEAAELPRAEFDPADRLDARLDRFRLQRCRVRVGAVDDELHGQHDADYRHDERQQYDHDQLLRSLDEGRMLVVLVHQAGSGWWKDAGF